MIPKGLRLLQGAKRSEDFTTNFLKECCEDYPEGCGHEEECKRLFDARCGEWRFRRRNGHPARIMTEAERYSDWMPTIEIRRVVKTIRESYTY